MQHYYPRQLQGEVRKFGTVFETFGCAQCTCSIKLAGKVVHLGSMFILIPLSIAPTFIGYSYVAFVPCVKTKWVKTNVSRCFSALRLPMVFQHGKFYEFVRKQGTFDMLLKVFNFRGSNKEHLGVHGDISKKDFLPTFGLKGEDM